MSSVEPSGAFRLGDRLVRRLGYGAMRLSGPGIFGPPSDPKTAVAVLREAVSSGVNHIDTSDYYGPHITNQLIREVRHVSLDTNGAAPNRRCGVRDLGPASSSDEESYTLSGQLVRCGKSNPLRCACDEGDLSIQRVPHTSRSRIASCSPTDFAASQA